MKIQIISLGMTDKSHCKFYNTQDMGLGRAFAKAGHEVDLFSFFHGEKKEIVVFQDNFRMNYLPSKSLGFHSLHSCDFITKDVDAVICFADNQLNFRKVSKRCKQNSVLCLPYVGAIGSHNSNWFKKIVLDFFISNIKYFRAMKVAAKTPDVKKRMEILGVKDVELIPCGLDMSVVHDRYAEEDKHKLREEIGLQDNNKVVLFMARLIAEKQPLEMVEIFHELYGKDSSYRLVSIGKGELQEAFEKKIAEKGLMDAVIRIESIANEQVWKYYVIADAIVNLNRDEIFGMSILEAMYYECPVVARRAPGPEYILTDETSGFLCDDNSRIIDRVEEICKNKELKGTIVQNAKRRVTEDFTWEASAKKMLNIIEGK